MDVDVRRIRFDEQGVWSRRFAVAVGEEWGPQEFNAWESYLDREHSLAAFDGDDMVGTAAAFGTELTLPGGATVPTAAVTGISVLPTHRRRGIGNALMRAQLDDIVEAGSTVAVLETSEAPIYGRYGYGAATTHHIAAVETAYGAFRGDVEVAPSRFSFAEGEAVAGFGQPIFDAYRTTHPGELYRTAGWWAYRLLDPPLWRNGGPLQAVFHVDAAGEPDGYLLYRLVNRWEAGLPAGEIMVNEVVATDPAVYAALWRYALDMDLMRVCTGTNLRLDEPLKWLLEDTRRLRTVETRDGLWVRPVDLPGLLRARTYGSGGVLTVEVVDDWLPANAGRWRIDVKDGTAEVSPTDEPAGLTVDVSVIGSVSLGGVRWSTLADAGRIVAHQPEAVALADRMFAAEREPGCLTEF